MGTRSITRIYQGTPDEKPKAVVQMYRQMDGYPSGHGAELAEFLKGMTVINGITDFNAKKTANGAGCLAAQMVAHFKTKLGGIYLEPVGTNEWVDYEYQVFAEPSQPIVVRVKSGRSKLFEGPVDEFAGFCKEEE